MGWLLFMRNGLSTEIWGPRLPVAVSFECGIWLPLGTAPCGPPHPEAVLGANLVSSPMHKMWSVPYHFVRTELNAE